jgi:hypothetical protein
VVSFPALPLFPGEKVPVAHWMGPGAGLDYVENRKFSLNYLNYLWK